MTDTEKYTPLSERLQQDVWHDNFVPKYSALASAKPSLLVLIGVWLIFVPSILIMVGGIVSYVLKAPNLLSAVITSTVPALFLVLGVAILAIQTKRYRAAKRRGPDEEFEEDEREFEEGDDDVDQS